MRLYSSTAVLRGRPHDYRPHRALIELIKIYLLAFVAKVAKTPRVLRRPRSQTH